MQRKNQDYFIWKTGFEKSCLNVSRWMHMKKNWLHGGVARRKQIWCQCQNKKNISKKKKYNKNMPNYIETNLKNFWNKNTWTNFLNTTINVTFVEESTKSMMNRYTIPTLKYGGGSKIIWGCVSFKGTGNKINTKCYQNYYEYLHMSGQKLCMERTWIFQHDKDSKHKVKSTCSRRVRWSSGVAIPVSSPQYHWATLG